jgi:hypothetical protein
MKRSIITEIYETGVTESSDADNRQDPEWCIHGRTSIVTER